MSGNKGFSKKKEKDQLNSPFIVNLPVRELLNCLNKPVTATKAEK
jgi:hypothetical protein